MRGSSSFSLILFVYISYWLVQETNPQSKRWTHTVQSEQYWKKVVDRWGSNLGCFARLSPSADVIPNRATIAYIKQIPQLLNYSIFCSCTVDFLCKLFGYPRWNLLSWRALKHAKNCLAACTQKIQFALSELNSSEQRRCSVKLLNSRHIVKYHSYWVGVVAFSLKISRIL